MMVLNGLRKDIGHGVDGSMVAAKKVFLEPSVSLSYLLGVLKGDGYVSKTKDGYYKIGLSATSKLFVENFAENLREIGLKPYPIHLYTNPTHNSRQYCVITKSVNFFKWYKNQTFRDIERIISGYEVDFIRGFYESEGTYCVTSSGQKIISLYNTNFSLLKLVRKILKKVNIDSKIYCMKQNGYGTKSLFRLTVLGGNSAVNNFIVVIKPLIKNGGT